MAYQSPATMDVLSQSLANAFVGEFKTQLREAILQAIKPDIDKYIDEAGKALNVRAQTYYSTQIGATIGEIIVRRLHGDDVRK